MAENNKNQTQSPGWSCTRSIGFGFWYSKCGSSEIHPHEHRLALQHYIADMLERLNKIDVPGLADGEGI